MKPYYAVIQNYVSTKDKFLLIGYHEKKKTVIRYFESITKEDKINKDTYKVVKIHKKKLKKIEGYYDNYLIRFGPTFIPIKDFELAKDCICSNYADLKYADDVLQRIYHTESISNTDRKALKRVIILLEILKDELKESAVNPTILKSIQQSFEQYKNSIYFENSNSYNEEIPFI